MEKKEFIIVGTGDFADLIADTILNDMHRQIAAYVVDRKYMKETKYNGVPVVAYEEISEKLSVENHSVVIGFIGDKMYRQRYEKYLELKEMGYAMENVIHSTASISLSSELGDGNILLQYAVVAAGASIGNCNVITPRAYVCHHVHMGNANYFAPGVSTSGYVEIGNNCFLGINSSVNNKVKLADYTFVGGGMFITNNTNEYDVYLPQKSMPMKRLRSIDFRIFTSRREE